MGGLGSEAASREDPIAGTAKMSLRLGIVGNAMGCGKHILLSLESTDGTGDTYNSPLACEPSPPHRRGEEMAGKGAQGWSPTTS